MGKDMRAYEMTAAALAAFGNVGLMIPVAGAKNGELSAMLIAFIASVIIYGVCFAGLRRFKTRQISEKVFYAVGIVLVMFCIYVCTETSRHFIDFVSTEVLIKNRKIYCAAAFLCVCIYAFGKGACAVTKLSAAALGFIIAVTVALFLVSFENFDPGNLLPSLSGKPQTVALRSIKYLGLFFVSPVVFAVFSAFYFEKPSLKAETLGLTVGTALLCLCFLSATLTFSLPEAAQLKHSYSASISVISVGELFTRMEGIAYFVFFFSALVKTVICALAIKALLLAMNVRDSKSVARALLIGAITVSYIL